MSNFGFLKEHHEYDYFAPACIEAERVYATSPAMCAIGCRKALELAVKWVYVADNTISKPYRDNLQSLIHEDTFMGAIDHTVWRSLPYIIRLGNLAVHTERAVKRSDAVASLAALFDFVSWIDYCYGNDYEERTFEERKIPSGRLEIDVKKIKEQGCLIEEKEDRIKELEEQIKQLSGQFTKKKGEAHSDRTFDPTEAVTRDQLIDIDLQELGWHFDGPEQNVKREYVLHNYKDIPGKVGSADYVLFGRDGNPLAVIETKRTRINERDGREQAVEYAKCLERKFGIKPMIFLSNGYETRFNERDLIPEHKVSGFFTQDSLQRIMNRRKNRCPLNEIPINDDITNRVYQKLAIRKVCEEIGNGRTKHLLVMATGAGKTRTSSSLVDVLLRGNYVKNILFLADRRALVSQACNDFKNYLPNTTLCNLLENREDYNARIVFSTYPTILQAIDTIKKSNGQRAFTPAHFDLIILDEAHRSIFRKYKAIFQYFDAHLLGLTATPKDDDTLRDTYTFFEMERGVPTYAYSYEEAKKEGYLVAYYSIIVKRLFETEGIDYDKLSDEDKARYEDDFAEDDNITHYQPPTKINDKIFNKKTIDDVLTEVMDRGMKVAGGDRIAKTIIFAQNKNHAERIVERFHKLFPHLDDDFIQRVICDDSGSDAAIRNFKQPESPNPYSYDKEKKPHIVVSVDMMDTGIDVPHIGNLVFFKVVRSKTKFWQMLGRGTRKCPGMECVDFIDGSYTDKKRFFVFDYCNNFPFFKENPNGIKATDIFSRTEEIYQKQIDIIKALQHGDYASERYQAWRKSLVDTCHGQVIELRGLMDMRTDIKLERRYINKYVDIDQFVILDETKRKELAEHIAPIVISHDEDDYAKQFDAFMYGMILVLIDSGQATKYMVNRLNAYARGLESIGSVPTVKPHLPLIYSIQEPSFCTSNDILKFEEVREKLRGLIRLIPRDKENDVDTNLTNPEIGREEGVELDAGYDFEDYRQKVNQYVNSNRNMLVIYKLTHNQKLTQGDYKVLEHILTVELGNKDDYKREFGDTPFGLLIRKIAKLDHDAVMAAFSGFINDENLTAQQIYFVHQIISYVENNGYMEDAGVLLRAPFDRPVPFFRLFKEEQQKKLIDTINEIRTNAEVVA